MKFNEGRKFKTYIEIDSKCCTVYGWRGKPGTANNFLNASAAICFLGAYEWTKTAPRSKARRLLGVGESRQVACLRCRVHWNSAKNHASS